MQDDVVDRPELTDVFAAHSVAVAYLFGSRAEGTARPTSDYDVAVLFASPEPALDATVRLAADLAGVLGTDVDVVDLDRAELELGMLERYRLLLGSTTRTRTGDATSSRPPHRSRSTWRTTSSPPTGTGCRATTATRSGCSPRSACSTTILPGAWSPWPGPGA